MNAETKIKELNDEVRAIKAFYDQASQNLILYTYELNISNVYFISKTVTLNTEDGSNAIAYIEGATYDRMPYEGGVKFYLYTKLGNGVVKLHTMQKGTITIS